MTKRRLSVTVCICTYNRAQSLKNTLESLTAMSAMGQGNWELLLIDNNSTDESEAVAYSFADRLPVRYVFESDQGLSYARNRAIQECGGDMLIFTDDDVQVSPDWLKEFFNAAMLFQQADYFGGRVLPHWPNGRPAWLKDEGMPLLGGLLVRYDLGAETRMYETEEPLPFGASFGIRRSLFECLEPFCVDLGVSGNTPGRGEEGDYLARAGIQGFQGAYVGESLCYHWVDPARLKLTYMYRFGIQKGVAEVRMNRGSDLNGSFRRELNYAVRGLWQLAKGRGDRFRQCVINMGIQAGIRRASGDKDLVH